MRKEAIYLRSMKINCFPEQMELAQRARVSITLPGLNDGVFGTSWGCPPTPKPEQGWWWR